MVRLGARTLSRGKLSASAMARGLETLRKYKRLAESAGAEKILAVATSAIREAANGEDFLERVGQRAGHLAARHLGGRGGAPHLPRRPAQRAPGGPPRPGGRHRRGQRRAGRRRRARAWSTRSARSSGVLRMTEEFVKSDPLSAKDEARLVKHVAEGAGPAPRAPARLRLRVRGGHLRHHPGRGRPRPPARGRGRAGAPPSRDGARPTRSTPRGSGSCPRDLKTRLKTPGLDESRADIIVAGAVVLDTILQELGRAAS